MSRIKFEDFYDILENRVNHSLTSKEISRHTYEEGIACLLISNDDQYVFMGSIDGSILAFDLSKKELTSLYKMSGSDPDITAIAVTVEDKYIIFGSSHGSIGVFDWNKKKIRGLFENVHKGELDHMNGFKCYFRRCKLPDGYERWRIFCLWMSRWFN